MMNKKYKLETFNFLNDKFNNIFKMDEVLNIDDEYLIQFEFLSIIKNNIILYISLYNDMKIKNILDNLKIANIFIVFNPNKHYKLGNTVFKTRLKKRLILLEYEINNILKNNIEKDIIYICKTI